ncbi:winged helix-turn-helix domain-containing protein [Kitasatospora purpeofusca]|uniref:winged helix-turn-helix domain-containing protein n=1 Tax=Kitasatospora purpeofusca TaxID=67352 RepID=UPI0035DE0455
MLRIHFTHEDLTKVRFARAPDPLAESMLSLSLLQAREAGGVAMEGWRSRTRRGLRPELRVLFDLATPAGAAEAAEALLHAGSHTLPESLEQTWSLPGRRWTADLSTLSGMRPRAPRWVYELHRGEREWRELVDRRLREYHAFAIAPYWSQLLATAHTDRARRATLAADLGLDGLFGSLHPGIRWRSPVLTLPCPVDAELRLRGAGVMLVPTFFWPDPIALTDNRGLDHPLVLHYPLVPDLTTYRAIWSQGAPDGPDGSLTALLGTTRARTLYAVADPAGTAELARRTGTSPATASHHAAVLRAAGLLITERAGPGVRHTLTPLGQALLDDRTADRPRPPATARATTDAP